MSTRNHLHLYPAVASMALSLAALAPPLISQEGSPEQRPGRQRGEAKRPPTERGKLHAIARAGREIAKVGAEAPDFALPLLEGSQPTARTPLDLEGRVRLSAFRGERPVVLIFGSYT